ncbi:hypothetical protein TYRP_016850 [Tyrophagus putrescentiae]|nr:hypothetical protein TYRP_016850 [Tyrophagus putrescentiae]
MAAGHMADTNYRTTTRRLHSEDPKKDFNLQDAGSSPAKKRARGRRYLKSQYRGASSFEIERSRCSCSPGQGQETGSSGGAAACQESSVQLPSTSMGLDP